MPHTSQEYHKQRNILIKTLGGQCEHCNGQERLEFHTKDGSGEHGCGGWKKLYLVKINMEKGNIQLLCHDCHTAHHIKYGFQKNHYQVNYCRREAFDNQY